MWSDGAVVIVKRGNPEMADTIEKALVKPKTEENNGDELTKNKIARLEKDQLWKGKIIYGSIYKKEHPVKRFLQVSWACLYWLLFGEKE